MAPFFCVPSCDHEPFKTQRALRVHRTKCPEALKNSVTGAHLLKRKEVLDSREKEKEDKRVRLESVNAAEGSSSQNVLAEVREISRCNLAYI